jgi:hypothetical protein
MLAIMTVLSKQRVSQGWLHSNRLSLAPFGETAHVLARILDRHARRGCIEIRSIEIIVAIFDAADELVGEADSRPPPTVQPSTVVSTVNLLKFGPTTVPPTSAQAHPPVAKNRNRSEAKPKTATDDANEIDLSEYA